MDLVLYRQAVEGEWKVYRHSGAPNTRWRLCFEKNDEGKADAQYERIYGKLRQGGVRMVDPEGRVIKEFYASPMRWGGRDYDSKLAAGRGRPREIHKGRVALLGGSEKSPAR